MKNLKNNRRIALTLAILIFCEAIIPNKALALTSGPTQPEFSSFQPVNATDMVDMFSGDFKYNIPLLNVPGHQGGYPINLFYNSVTNMDDEASMVGLGWNLGIGSISRTVRGIPDDFDGEKVKRTTSIKPQISFGVTFRPDIEIFGLEPEKVKKGSFSPSYTVSYDTYNGIGFGLGLGINLMSANSSVSGSFGLNSNSLDGLSYSADISTSFKGSKGKTNQANGSGGLGITGNSIDGLTGINFGISNQLGKNYGLSYGISDRPTYFPSNDLEFSGFSHNVSAKGGIELFGGTVNGSVSGFISERKLISTNVFSRAYGTMYNENGQKDNKSLLDFNRINDKPLQKNATHLPVSMTTEDAYIISGQGTGGSFSFKRDDSGVFRDKSSESKTFGQTFHVELAGGNLLGVGAEFSLNQSNNTNDAYKVNTETYKFSNDVVNSPSEKGHFRKSSEFTGDIFSPGLHPRATSLKRNVNYLGGDKHFRFGLNPGAYFKRATLQNNIIDNKTGTQLSSNDLKRSNRNPRQNAITYHKDKDIRIDINNIILPYLNCKISKISNPTSFGYTEPSELYTKLKFPNQIAAFEEINAQGQRYIYGLPVKNIKKKDVTFALAHDVDVCKTNVQIPLLNGAINHKPNQDGTDDLLDITETPEFVSSYMLTSILGDNYIDIDPTDGLPNDKDRGYWVKFSYTQTTDGGAYKYRIPFSGAQFNPGSHAIKSDDKGSFSYGEREQYYPTAIETNSHIAKFYYSQRSDGRGADTELQNSNLCGAYSYKLDSLKLYTKGQTQILEKTVRFTYYTNGLCPGIFNSTLPSKGKLTLKSVSIENYLNKRGSLNPYKFEYFDNQLATYGINKFDRWGVFKRVNNDYQCQNYYQPYTDQINANEDVKAFHLKAITLPSGSKINVDISRDHYAYVQDKVATTMVPIKGVGSVGSALVPKIPAANGFNDRRIYFDVLPGYTADDYYKSLYKDDNGYQVLFKIYSNMLHPDNNNYEYVTGAAYIDEANSSIPNGYITLKKLDLPVKVSAPFNKHPFLIANWQYLKVNLRKILSPGINVGPSNGVKSEVIKTFEKIKGVVTNFTSIFSGYYTKCYNNSYGVEIDLSKSFIRLNVPNKIKYGGGVKVDKITMSDIWDKEGVDIKYGNVYIYETEVKVGNVTRKVSNGVAANEPFLGKEENSMYYIKEYKQDLLYTTDNLYFEMQPFNDMYMPGPDVGYSKVTVRSLPSHDMNNKFKGITQGLPSYLTDTSNPLQVSTTGEAVYDFFTAKDFPVIFDNSDIKSSGYTPTWFPLLLVGFINTNAYTATQSYICETNDMHGKSKKVTYFAQNKNGEISEAPTSSVEYYYRFKEEMYNWGKHQLKRNRLVNDNVDLQVDYIQPDINNKKIYKGELGVDRSMNTDVRYVSGTSTSVGVVPGANSFLALIAPFVIPYAVPNIIKTNTTLETGVINKHINKKGILSKVIAFDGQSKIETENLVFDPYTGSALVTSVTDHFNQRKYNQNFPAYLGYDRMGPAYTNLGLKFNFNGTVQKDPCTEFHALRFDGSLPPYATYLVPGDEFIVEKHDTPVGKTLAVFQKQNPACCSNGSNFLLFTFKDPSIISADSPTGRNLTFTNIRSGRRNLLNNDGQQIVSLANTTGPSVTKVLSASANTYCDFWQYGDQKDNLCSTQVLPKNLTLHIDTIVHLRELDKDVLALSSDIYCQRSNSATINNPRADGRMAVTTRSYFKFQTQPLLDRLLSGSTVASCTLNMNFKDASSSATNAYLSIVGQQWFPYSIVWDPQPNVLTTPMPWQINGNTAPNFPLPFTLPNPTLTNKVWIEGFRLELVNENIVSFLALHGNLGNFAPTVSVEFNDGTNDPCNVTIIASRPDDFKSGAKGIFRMESQYNYKDIRNQNDTSTSIKVKEKGIFVNTYNVFDWKNPLFYKTTVYNDRWLLSNKVTKRNRSGDVVETKNALNIYNNALYVPLNYSTTNNSPIQNVVHASTKNSKYYESAVTSFEPYEQYSIPSNTENWNNFDISHISTGSQEKYRILNYYIDPNNQNRSIIVIDKKYNDFKRYKQMIAEIYSSERSSSASFSSFKGSIADEQEETTAPYAGFTKLTLNTKLDCDKSNNFDPDKAIIFRSNFAQGQIANASFTQTVSHTGKSALKLTGNTIIKNSTIDLFKGKEYYASCWVYIADKAIPNLNNQGIEVKLNGINLTFIGHRINGWQQIAGKFTYNNSVFGNNLEISIIKGTQPEIFIDDFRIHPFESSMESYVYDPSTFQLKYTLDDNNFYTRYVYDSEGKLISIQKETERGVKSLQEQRSFLRTNL